VTGEVLVAAAGEDFPVAVAPRAPAPVRVPTPTVKPSLPPVPIPGVTAPSATPVPPLPSGSGGSGGGKNGGGSGHAGPLVPESAAAPPVGGAGAILPPASPSEDPDALVEAAPASAVEPDSGDPASPWIPIGIGLGIGLLALAVPIALGRHYAW
jgi:hypothetical protein